MSGTAFEEFAEAVASQKRAPLAGSAVEYTHIAVLGGGSDAQLLAAICLSEGAQVTLFSAYGRELEQLRAGSGVTIRGAGPIGTYQVDREGTPSIRTTGELDQAVGQAEVIFLTGPVHKQRTYAMVLAEHLRDGQVLVIAPGRSLGAAEAAWMLRVGGCKADITIVEVQGLPYWTSSNGATLTLQRVAPVSAATLPAGRNKCLEGLKRFLPNIVSAISTVHSGFADGSGLVEVPALLLGGVVVGHGGPSVPQGGVPLEENRSFRALIGPGQIAVIARLAAERRAVASRFGVRDLPDDESWIEAHAGSERGDGRRPVPEPEQAAGIIRCATIGSLAPLLSAGRIAGVETPATSAMITLASTVLGADVEPAGRKLDAIGVNAGNLEEARRILDSIAGARRHG
ncbi:MAG: hypothetical protein KDJ66_16760 [Nitratireductor sp.]|nr:hypothetical protein [Nitratireductor sp.]